MYREQTELIFRSSNLVATRSPTGASTTLPTIGEPSSSNTSPHHSNLSGIRPSEPREQQALVFFFAKWVVEPRNGRRGNLDFLPALYGHGVEHDCLGKCLKAVSMATLANTPGANTLQTTSHSYYGQALRTLKASLNDPVLAKTDQILTSTALLQLYEVRGSTLRSGRFIC